MEDHGLVSIIVPVYNVAPYLVEALDSVVNQSYVNLEIILIDDGSTDGSGDICDRYARKDQRIRVIHQKNRGLSAARNAGLDMMNGDAVAFLDSDDAYHPEFISSMTDAMIRGKADLVVCGFSVHHTVGEMTANNQTENVSRIRQGVYDRKGALRAYVEGTINSVAWNKLYKKELWDGIRYPNGHVYEDVDTTYKIVNACNTVWVLDKPLYMYRKRKGSITATYSPSNIRDRMSAQTRFLSFIRDNIPDVFDDAQLLQSRQIWLARLISYYIHFPPGKEKEFRKELRAHIIESGRETGVDQCRFRIKVCYRMICFCPLILRMLAPVYAYGLRFFKTSIRSARNKAKLLFKR